MGHLSSQWVICLVNAQLAARIVMKINGDLIVFSTPTG